MGSELVIFSPSASEGYTRCGRSCMHVTADRVPPSGKLTTMPMDGGQQSPANPLPDKHDLFL